MEALAAVWSTLQLRRVASVYLQGPVLNVITGVILLGLLLPQLLLLEGLRVSDSLKLALWVASGVVVVAYLYIGAPLLFYLESKRNHTALVQLGAALTAALVVPLEFGLMAVAGSFVHVPMLTVDLRSLLARASVTGILLSTVLMSRNIVSCVWGSIRDVTRRSSDSADVSQQMLDLRATINVMHACKLESNQVRRRASDASLVKGLQNKLLALERQQSAAAHADTRLGRLQLLSRLAMTVYFVMVLCSAGVSVFKNEVTIVDASALGVLFGGGHVSPMVNFIILGLLSLNNCRTAVDVLADGLGALTEKRLVTLAASLVVFHAFLLYLLASLVLSLNYVYRRPFIQTLLSGFDYDALIVFFSEEWTGA
ncbi:MAG: uncharacterized protein KVP18_004853 [Porospora cf. gigantea A]|uniref:uncharacterized protein n=1 Tax=Porospora cf. gigantea A TaxID=2853593 RepID=UPI003559BECF|nr:MAG: hypothetical protein KVP18_004853 [Porospora cf. gigantea A]